MPSRSPPNRATRRNKSVLRMCRFGRVQCASQTLHERWTKWEEKKKKKEEEEKAQERKGLAG